MFFNEIGIVNEPIPKKKCDSTFNQYVHYHRNKISLTQNYLIDENISKRTKLGGLVKNGSIEISEINQLECVFILKEGDTELAVNYNKTRPDLFKDGAEVIVTGEYLNGIFYADELQTKCASRYEGDLRNESNYNLEEIDT